MTRLRDYLPIILALGAVLLIAVAVFVVKDIRRATYFETQCVEVHGGIMLLAADRTHVCIDSKVVIRP